VEIVQPPGPVTAGGWAIEPDGLREVLVGVAAEYDPPPLYVHEGGAAFDDEPGLDGQVDDTDRIDYLDAHLRAAHGALATGVDLRGFFVWSLLDNFEWAEGYAHRFGIVHIDFDTLQRTPKASAAWYAEVARTGAL
jgi:beta-glucosidase